MQDRNHVKGKTLIFSAPSGSGKTTIVRYLLKQNLNLEFSVSACSRKPRSEEVHGRDYYFLSVEEFRKNIEDGKFVEWEEVYRDHFYGTLKSELERIWQAGRYAIFDVDVIGGRNLKKIFGQNALAVFVKPPSLETLEERLTDRSTDSEEKILERIDKAVEEMEYAKYFDVVLVNDKLDTALEEALNIVKKFLET